MFTPRGELGKLVIKLHELKSKKKDFISLYIPYYMHNKTLFDDYMSESIAKYPAVRKQLLKLQTYVNDIRAKEGVPMNGMVFFVHGKITNEIRPRMPLRRPTLTVDNTLYTDGLRECC